MPRRTRQFAPLLQPTRWAGSHILDTVRRLNEHCFALLAQSARAERPPLECKAVYQHSGLWAKADSRASIRAARCPALLVDLNFQRADWWRRISGDSHGSPPAAERCVFSSAAQTASLVREVLTEAWGAARWMPSATTLLFGMVPPVTAVIARLPASGIDRIVAEHFASIRPRWEHRGEFWRHLLQAAVGTDERELDSVHIYCLQLLGTELALSGA